MIIDRVFIFLLIFTFCNCNVILTPKIKFGPLVLFGIKSTPLIEFDCFINDTIVFYTIDLGNDSLAVIGNISIYNPTKIISLQPINFLHFRNDLIFNISMYDRNVHKLLEEYSISHVVNGIPAWIVAFPTIFSIVLIIITRQSYIGLYVGVLSGSFIYNLYNPITAIFSSFAVVGVNVIKTNADIILFTFLLGGQIGLLRKGGGFNSIMKWLSKFIKTSRSGQIIAAVAGLLLNTDGYTSIFLVGVAFAPIFKTLRISSHKLAFIIDTTSGPASAISPISSYMAVGTRFIDIEFEHLNIDESGYLTFIYAIPEQFYTIFILFTVFVVGFTKKDIYPMVENEAKVRIGELQYTNTTNEEIIKNDFTPKLSIKIRSINALFPMLTMLIVTIIGLYFDGLTNVNIRNLDITFINIISNANAIVALNWGVTTSLIITLILYLPQKILTLKEFIEIYVLGMNSCLETTFLLIIAWSQGELIKAILLPQLVASWMIGLSPTLVPFFSMFMGAIISFSSGTSYGTLAVMFPIVIPLTHILASGDMTLMITSIGAVFSGAIFGDHCSPFSDVVVLSSMIAQVPPIEHVKTQLPYAILCGVFSLLSYLLIGLFKINNWIMLLSGLIFITMFIVIFGSNPGYYNIEKDETIEIKRKSLARKLWNEITKCVDRDTRIIHNNIDISFD